MDSTQIVLIAAAALIVLLTVWWVIRSRSATKPETPKVAPGSRVWASGLGLSRVWRSSLDDTTWEDLEDVLLAADVGVSATAEVVRSVRSRKPGSVEEAKIILAEELRHQFDDSRSRDLTLNGAPSVVIVVGVNGSGKTTTIAKLARELQMKGKIVLLGAADTFRAAAAEQLVTWGDRLGFRVVRGSEGADPASVVHDALAAGRASQVDVVIIDTAGRLHGKKNLMAELGKIYRVAGTGDRVDEVLLVLDATSGQNGLAQVREFAETVPLTGIILSKLDGTAKGGIVIAVEKELGVPIKYVGIGEMMDDLERFEPDRFVSELLDQT